MKKEVYKGKYVQVHEEHHQNALYELATIKDAVIVFPFDTKGNLLLIKEFRPHENPSTKLKMVTGFLEENLTWKENAQKELQEEIGFGANQIQLFHHHKETGNINLNRYFCIAWDLYPSKINGADDEKNILSIEKFKWDDALNLIPSEIVLTFDSVFMFYLDNLLKKNKLQLEGFPNIF